MELAVQRPDERDGRRRTLAGKITKNSDGKLGFNANNRQQSVDLARLDLADHLWVTDPRFRTEGVPGRDFGVNDMAALLSFDNGRINILAAAIMRDAGKEISEGIDNRVQNERTAREIQKHMARHGWCSLLVALIQLIDKANKAVGLVADAVKLTLKDALSKHLTGRIAEQVKDAVVDIVVDRVWSALTRLLDAHFPLLGADTVRVLRMLAVFACPWVEQHRDVYQHALVPLMDDGRGLVAEEVKAQVATLFTAWWQRKGQAVAP
ncbi:hypothetical protein ACLQ3F_07120 [Micromonospora sp. DT15]|uniref:hypothetical protein n=1 Tax=Micromonospora sp. DT15 TaxID=3393445 RepID=UPI003CEC389B